MNINECSGSICDTHCQSSDIIKCTDLTPVVEGDQNYKCECSVSFYVPGGPRFFIHL